MMLNRDHGKHLLCLAGQFWKEVYKRLSVEERERVRWTRDCLPEDGVWKLSTLLSSLEPDKMSKYKTYNICTENQNPHHSIYLQPKSSIKISNFFITWGFKNTKINWENLHFYFILIYIVTHGLILENRIYM